MEFLKIFLFFLIKLPKKSLHIFPKRFGKCFINNWRDKNDILKMSLLLHSLHMGPEPLCWKQASLSFHAELQFQLLADPFNPKRFYNKQGNTSLHQLERNSLLG